MIAILNNSVAIFCTISAATLLFYDKSGWGWFLFAAVITTSYGYGK